MRSDLSDMIAGTDLLRERAEAVLRQRLETNPTDSDSASKLAEICRQKGLLEEALNLYRRFNELHPDSLRRALLCMILAGEDIPDSLVLHGLRPAPWVRITNFLTKARQEEIWELVDKKRSRFKESVIVGDGVNKKKRSSMVLYDDHLDQISPWFLARVESTLSGSWSRLQVKPFETDQSEIQLTRHMDGAFFKIHTDAGDKQGTETRKVTYVYYFHRLPRQFEGGDLLLYDTDTDVGGQSVGFTRLSPQHNSIVLFPSHFWHQVTPLRCASDDFEAGRFTLNGWLHDENRHT